MNEHCVEISVVSRGRSTRYRVTYRGEILAESGDPEYAACRALLQRGCTGTMVTRWRGSHVDAMRLHIERGAKLATEEGRSQRPRVIKWKPPDHGHGFEHHIPNRTKGQ